MSDADKRTIHTDALGSLGTIINGEQGRDAIHLAVIPARCGYGEIKPGAHVALDSDGRTAHESSYAAIGIADPFLKEPVKEGQWFWLVIYPRVITSLRHVWTHPKIMDEAGVTGPKTYTKEESEAWLRKFCEIADCPGYDSVIAAITGKLAITDSDYYDSAATLNEDYFHFDGRDAHGSIPDEFWTHIENVTGGKDLPRAKHFSCSC